MSRATSSMSSIISNVPTEHNPSFKSGLRTPKPSSSVASIETPSHNNCMTVPVTYTPRDVEGTTWKNALSSFLQSHQMCAPQTLEICYQKTAGDVGRGWGAWWSCGVWESEEEEEEVVCMRFHMPCSEHAFLIPINNRNDLRSYTVMHGPSLFLKGEGTFRVYRIPFSLPPL